MKINLQKRILIALFALPVCFQTAAHAQSLWHDDSARPMFADKRAAAVGDILTVVVQEITTAVKNNETKTEKNSGLSAAVSTFLFPGFLQYKGSMPAVDYKSDLKHDGSGAINNSETIVAHVAVKVIEVLPNHNLLVEGKRETSFSKEHQTIVLHGVVRPENIGADNTILSYNIADATISIVGKGTVTDSQGKGWFTRIWDKLNPF
jgi:flagellar L-ring protein precursor FlgH